MGMGTETVSAERRTVPWLRMAIRWYKAAAILLLNTIVLIIAINLVLWLVSLARSGNLDYRDPVSTKYPEKALQQIYAPMTDDARRQLLHETYTRPVRYEQYLEVTEAPYRGQYVNVSEEGYRIGPAPGPWPPDPKNYNIFVFGGSTTFGYGVADDQTIPAHLQEWLRQLSPAPGEKQRACIYNFGRGYYYSTPERILFEQLVQKGARPDLALFIDGINDLYYPLGWWEFKPQLQRALGRRRTRIVADVIELVSVTPLGKAMAALRPQPATAPATTAPSDEDSTLVKQAMERYLWNKRTLEVIAAENHIRTLFVFQPASFYQYDVTYHLFKGDDWPKVRLAAEGYLRMDEYVKSHPMGDDFLWLADMQVNVQKPLYCDMLHYTPEFNKQIADRIGTFLAKQRVPR